MRILALALISLSVSLSTSCSSNREAQRLAPAEPVSPSPTVQTPALEAEPEVDLEPERYDLLGATIEVELALSQPEIMVSEPIYVQAIVHNRSDTPLVLQASWMGRNQLGRPENYQLEAVSTKGKPVPVPASGPNFGGQSWEVELKGDKPFEVRLFLPSWAAFAEPGRYRLHFRTALRLRAATTTDWTELAVSANAALSVVADDDARLGELVTRVAARAVAADSNHEERRILGAIRDPRVIPHLAVLMKSDRYDRRFEAARVLGTWNDDRALAALEGAMMTRASDLDPAGYTTELLREQSAAQLRLAVAQALAQSPHPAAIDRLLSLKNDPARDIRLTIVHASSALEPARAKPLLQTFAKDRDPTVASEARRYLAEM